MDRVSPTHTAAADMLPAPLPTKVSPVNAHDKLVLLTSPKRLLHIMLYLFGNACACVVQSVGVSSTAA